MLRIVDTATQIPTAANIMIVMRENKALPALHPSGHFPDEDIVCGYFTQGRLWWRVFGGVDKRLLLSAFILLISLLRKYLMKIKWNLL